MSDLLANETSQELRCYTEDCQPLLKIFRFCLTYLYRTLICRVDTPILKVFERIVARCEPLSRDPILCNRAGRQNLRKVELKRPGLVRSQLDGLQRWGKLHRQFSELYIRHAENFVQIFSWPGGACHCEVS